MIKNTKNIAVALSFSQRRINNISIISLGHTIMIIGHTAYLIKFVRNAPPTLRWFRSDFTPDNMKILRMERPEIELLN
jgi:hypothetical protein